MGPPVRAAIQLSSVTWRSAVRSRRRAPADFAGFGDDLTGLDDLQGMDGKD